MEKQKIGLALSGGGYRAAAFHLGVLKKLNELNILNKIDIISTVSGGSIIGAYYLLNKDNFITFESNFKNLLRYNIQYRLCGTLIFIGLVIFSVVSYLTYILLYSNCNFWFYLSYILLLTLITCFLIFFKIIPSNKILNYIYNKKFFCNRKLIDFPSEPQIIVNSSNIETGTILSFSRNMVKDSSYKYKTGIKRDININTSNVNVSFAVTASSAFSPLFQPLKFKQLYFIDTKDYNIYKPLLIDGGVYDNQGIHNIANSDDPYLICDTIICSDCSQPYKLKYKYLNPYSLLKKTIDFLMRRIRNFQFQHFIYRSCSRVNNIAYFSIGWSFDNCIVGFVNAITKDSAKKQILIKLHSIPNEIINSKEELEKYIKNKIKYKDIIPDNFKNNYDFSKFESIKTNLKPINPEIESELIQYASILTELQIKLYCPFLI